jgi:hypothetical protein
MFPFALPVVANRMGGLYREAASFVHAPGDGRKQQQSIVRESGRLDRGLTRLRYAAPAM